MNPIWFVNWSQLSSSCFSEVKTFYTKKEAFDFAALKPKFSIMKRNYFPEGGVTPYDELLVVKADYLWPRDLLMLKSYTNLGFEQIEEIRKKGLVE